MYILVTGGAGFIGGHLVRALAEGGSRVRVLDNLSTGRRENLAEVGAEIELIEGDIRNPEALRRALDGAELVFHLAAMVSVVQSVEQPLEAQETNATGTIRLLEAARAAGVRRVVQASSCAVYGDPGRMPIGEDTPAQPLSPYALTKLAAEQAGQLYTSLYGLETVALRFFNVYGPRQDPASPYAAAVPRFVAALRDGRAPTIYGDGLQTRDFVYVGDVVRALWTAATVAGIGGEVFNVGRGEACSVRDLVQTLLEVLGSDLAPAYAPARAGEVRHSQADVSRFAARAGFSAEVGLREGLALTIGMSGVSREGFALP